MSDDNFTRFKTPSDYVRLEADLISGTSEKESAVHPPSQSRSILIYGTSHGLLKEIASDLKSSFGSGVEVLTTNDKTIALKLIKSGEIDLFLHGPSPELMFPNLAGNKNRSIAGIGSALILMNTPNAAVEGWMNDPEHSRHLTHAISRLNEMGF